MKKKQTIKQDENKSLIDSNWVEIIKDWVFENTKFLTNGLIGELKGGVEKFFQNMGQNMSRTIFSSLTMFSGLVFMMIGLAVLVNDLIGISDSIGYIIVGFIVVLVGMFTNKNL